MSEPRIDSIASAHLPGPDVVLRAYWLAVLCAILLFGVGGCPQEAPADDDTTLADDDVTDDDDDDDDDTGDDDVDPAFEPGWTADPTDSPYSGFGHAVAGGDQFPETDREPVTVTWHDSCHLGRASGIYEPPRELIKAVPGVDFVEMESCGDNAKCCGSVLTLIKDPETAHDLGKDRLDEAVAAGADKVLALCPCCEFQLRVSADKRDVPVEVQDLAHFSAAALGYEFADPHPEVRAQWAVFEAMIALMTPRGFAELMGTMWPELIDAMPLGMGGMMRTMGKIPGVLGVMRPMFPILFPRLLPMMMPKLMPAMLERVAARVPMPDYMAEQMPEMMPEVMGNLMPHMIDDVVPLVTEPMIDYLEGHDAA